MIRRLLFIAVLIAEVYSLGRDPCENYGCQNGGTCMAPFDEPSCVCPSGFVGQFCENADPIDLVSLCSRIDCMPDAVCRAVIVCSTCSPEAVCVPLSALSESTDIECTRQRYLQVLLETSDNTSYNQVKCRGPLATQDCPLGSAVCVDDLRGGGTCCFGKLIQIDKPGTCPAVEEDSVSTCGGSVCLFDLDCPGEEKCCDHACGSRQCMAPSSVQTSPCPHGCPLGFNCQLRPFPCPPGSLCPQVMEYRCVQPIDECGGCPDGQECVSTGIVCKKAPCPSFQCVEKSKDKVVSSCAECSPFEKCTSTGVACIMAPCPSFKCVSIPPRPPVACNPFCRKGYTCVLREPTCTRRYCNRRPVPTCVPDVPQLATCPKPTQIFTLNDLVCRIRNINRGCQSDAECDPSANQRCCLDLCNRMVCTTVPRLSI